MMQSCMARAFLQVLVLTVVSQAQPSATCDLTGTCRDEAFQDAETLSLAQLRAQQHSTRAGNTHTVGHTHEQIPENDGEQTKLSIDISDLVRDKAEPKVKAAIDISDPVQDKSEQESKEEDAGHNGRLQTTYKFSSEHNTEKHKGANDHRRGAPTGDPVADHYHSEPWKMEIYIDEMKSFNDTTCGYKVSPGAFHFARIAAIGSKTTGCLTADKAGHWFAHSTFPRLRSEKVAYFPEFKVQFAAWLNDQLDGDPCWPDEKDICHVQEVVVIGATQIHDYGVWHTQTLGSEAAGHLMKFKYKLSPYKAEDAECIVYGDPHIVAFDKTAPLLSFLEGQDSATDSTATAPLQEGDFWLVKSDDVHIQGRFNIVRNENQKHRSFLRHLAVGGPFLANHTLLLGYNSSKHWWDETEILKECPSEFVTPIVKATYHDDSVYVQDPTRQTQGVDIILPKGVKLLVNPGKNGLGVRITMPKLPAGTMDGECGNFEKALHEDSAELVSGRVGNEVLAVESMFKHPFEKKEARHARRVQQSTNTEEAEESDSKNDNSAEFVSSSVEKDILPTETKIKTSLQQQQGMASSTGEAGSSKSWGEWMGDFLR